MNVEITPEAEADLELAFQWYRHANPRLAFDFLRAVDERLQSTRRFPEAYAYVQAPVRRALVARFPFSLYFTREANRIVVLACLHHARDPESWRVRAPREGDSQGAEP